MVSTIVVDTGVFVEYIDRKARFHEHAKAIIDSLGELQVYLAPITVAEMC